MGTQSFASVIEGAKAFPEIVALYVIGSAASGRRTPLSDYDFAVWLRVGTKPAERRRVQLALIDTIASKLGDDRVDVVVLNDAPPGHQYQMLRDGRLLCANDNAARVELEALALSRYFDWMPLQRPLQMALIERAKSGRLGRG